MPSWSGALQENNNELPEPEPNVFDIYSGYPVEGTMDDEYFAAEKNSTLATLEELIEKVENDECVGIGIVMGTRSGTTRELTSVSTVFSGAASEYAPLFMGGCDVLKNRIYEDSCDD